MLIKNNKLQHPESYSVLTITETVAGIWYYQCNIALTKLENVSNETDYISIVVTGKCLFL